MIVKSQAVNDVSLFAIFALHTMRWLDDVIVLVEKVLYCIKMDVA